MTERIRVGGLQVAKVLFDFINNEAIPGSGVTADAFWAGADAVFRDLAPKNRALLDKRDELQAQIDGLAPRAGRQASRRGGLQGLPGADRLPAATARAGTSQHRKRR